MYQKMKMEPARPRAVIELRLTDNHAPSDEAVAFRLPITRLPIFSYSLLPLPQPIRRVARTAPRPAASVLRKTSSFPRR